MNLIEKIIQNFEKALGFVGLVVIFWMVHRLSPVRILANLRLVGWGFFLMVLMQGLHYLFETMAWRSILGHDDRKKVGFWKMFKINLQGEALNYITLTRMGGEPLKVISISDSVGLAHSAASVIVQKFCVIFGFWLTIAVGFLAVLFHADVTGEIKNKMAFGLLALTVFILLASWLQRMGMFSPLSWVLKQFQSKWHWVSDQVLRLTHLDSKILETYHSRPLQVSAAIFFNAFAWIEEILFIWLTVYFLKMDEHWFTPVLVGTIAMMMNSLFFFVPWRAGTQEGTMVLSFNLLNLSEPAGLSVAILRRLREMVWIFAGLILFALESLPSRTQNVPSQFKVP